MKKIINKIRTSIWLYPTIYSLFAFVLSISITIIDKTYTDESLNYVNELFYTTSSLAQAVLSIIAGAFITISTFTFSTTMVVLTMYSSQFTPRVVENFLNNKTTMKSFGIFLSGFIYAITSLLFIDTNKDGNLVIAASVGVIYIIVGLVYFLLFIHNVSTHIQASDLISRLHEEAIGRN
jgi:Predicted membrane protein